MTPAAPAQTAGLTDAQRVDARTWMQAARVWSIERFPYLDTALTSMLLVEAPGLGTVAVDARWRLYYDPARVLEIQRQHGIEVLASDWVHEVMHVLRDHPARWVDLREPPSRARLFNLAGDAHVNDDVAELGLPILPSDVTFARLPHESGCTRAMPTEEVYQRLLAIAVSTPVDCGSGAGGDRRGWEQSIADEQQDGSIANDDADIVREETARKVRARADRGDNVPTALMCWAGDYLEPSVDWRSELRSVVSRRLGQRAGTTDYTFTRPSRRRVPGFTFPGMAGPAPARVAAVIDTSGSMTAGELAQCLGDLLGLVRSVAGDGAAVTVMSVDMRVVDVVTVRRPADVPGLHLLGGGGTDMTVGLDACTSLRPLPDVVVVMTDGETPWPSSPLPGLEAAAVIALLSQPAAATRVPSWMRSVPMR